MSKQKKRTLKLVKGFGITAILMVLMLGATDAVFAQADDYIYSRAFTDSKISTTVFSDSGRPLWVAQELPAQERLLRWVPGQVPLYNQLENVGTEWTSCGPTTLAMALNYSASGPTPQEIIAYAVSQRGQDGKPLYEPQDPDKVFTSPKNLFKIAEKYGRPQEGWVTDERVAKAKLRELLNENLPVIVDVTVSLSRSGSNSAHFVLVTGIGTDNTVTVNDPYGAGLGAQVRTVSWDDFYWAWQNNSDGPVGGQGWWMVVRSGWFAKVG